MIKKSTCRNINRLVYLTDDEMSPQESLLLTRHLETCSSCKKEHDAFLSARAQSLLSRQPVPVYPDFTASTGKILKTGPSSPEGKTIKLTAAGWNRTFQLVRYVSAIASVVLLILFLWEQTVTVQKISSLEHRVQSTINPLSPGLIDRITLARSALTLQEWNELEPVLNLKRSGPYLPDYSRIRQLIEQRLRAEQTAQPAIAGFIRYTLANKKNAIILNHLMK